MSNNSVELQSIYISFRKEKILENAFLSIGSNTFVSLLGPSGSGKTTLLRAIAGFIPIDHGTIHLLDNNHTNSLPEHRPISMLFQDPVLFPHFSVIRNATVGLTSKSISKNIDYELNRLVQYFRLNEHKNRKINSNLSGGEKQRAALLRTFANAKNILLLDEPLKSALNVELRWYLMRSIKNC